MFSGSIVIANYPFFYVFALRYTLVWNRKFPLYGGVAIEGKVRSSAVPIADPGYTTKY